MHASIAGGLLRRQGEGGTLEVRPEGPLAGVEEADGESGIELLDEGEVGQGGGVLEDLRAAADAQGLFVGDQEVGLDLRLTEELGGLGLDLGALEVELGNGEFGLGLELGGEALGVGGDGGDLLVGLLLNLLAELFDLSDADVELGLLAGGVLALAVSEVLLLGLAGGLDGGEDFSGDLDVADDGVVDDDGALAEGALELVGHLGLELHTPFAIDEVARLVVRALHPRDGEDLGEDNLVDHGREVAVEHVDLGDVLGEELELHGHIQEDLEAVDGGELDELVHPEGDRIGERDVDRGRGCRAR